MVEDEWVWVVWDEFGGDRILKVIVRSLNIFFCILGCINIFFCWNVWVLGLEGCNILIYVGYSYSLVLDYCFMLGIGVYDIESY